MAEIYYDHREIYRKLGEIQPEIDELFHQAIEDLEFQSATIVVRLNVGVEGNVDNAEVLSEEYKKSKFGKMICELAKKSLVPGEKFKNEAIRLRLIWSSAYHLLGESVMSPLNTEHVEKIYVGGVIRKKYTASIHEMFRKLDHEIGVPVYGNTIVEVLIGKDGKVENSSLMNHALHGTLLDKHVAQLVKNWDFPGIKNGLKVKVVLKREVSQVDVRRVPGRNLGGGVATEMAAYPMRQVRWGYPYLRYGIPYYHGGPATELIAYPTRPGLPYAHAPIYGGVATELVAYPTRQTAYPHAYRRYGAPLYGGTATEIAAYPTRPGFQYAYPHYQYGYPYYHGGPATELIAYPTRPGLQYAHTPIYGGVATEVVAYPTRPGLQYVYPHYRYGYPPYYGGPATELIGYPTRQV